jgi:nuclear transport factor 2 (NTF2) superfamily protein
MPRAIPDAADILPPFTAETAAAKVRPLQDADGLLALRYAAIDDTRMGHAARRHR